MNKHTTTLILISTGKSKSGKGVSSIAMTSIGDYADVKAVVDIDQYWTDLEKIVNDQRQYFVQHITVR